MPAKSTFIRLSPEQDRRRKLLEEQKQEIRYRYANENISMKKLAAEYGVSKSLVVIIINPESAKRIKDYGKDNWKKYQIKGEEWNKIMRNHRRYKQELYLKGELIRDEKQ